MIFRSRGLAMLASILLVAVACTGAPAPGSPSAPAQTLPPGDSPAATEPTATEPTGTEPTGTEPAATEPTATEPPEADVQLVYAIDGQVTQLTNALSDVPTAEAVQWMYNGIYRYNEKLEPVPDLAAEAAEISEDGLTWTVTLVENATFQPGGQNMTAADVVFTYEMSNSENCRFNPSVCLAFVTVDADQDPETEPVPVLESVEAVDDYTVRFQLADKYAPFETVILPGILIDSQQAVEDAFEEFQQNAGQVTAQAAGALQEQITTESAAEEPDLTQFIPQLEQMLDQAGIERPQGTAEEFPVTGEDGNVVPGEVDQAAYADALIALFNDLANSLLAEGIDAIAAAYPLLSISREPVGTGPFYVTAFRAGERIELARNDEYHHGAPQVSEMFIPIITDDVAGAQALLADQIDWKYSFTADGYNQVANAPNVKLAQYADFGYFGLQFNLREGKLFADKNLRQALAYCIPKDQIVSAATQDQGVSIYADIPPASWAYNPELPRYELNAERGIELIQQSGWEGSVEQGWTKGGQRLATTVLVRAGRPDRIAFMSLLRDEAKKNCGFDFTITEVDFGTVLVPMLSWPHTQQGKPGNNVIAKQFDAYFGGWSTGFDPDPYSIWHSSQCTTPEQTDTYNYICFQNEQADQLIEEGLRELDREKRAEMYREFEAILAEELPYLFAWADIAREGVDQGLNYTDDEWIPGDEGNMNSPTWFWQFEKITKTTQ